MSISGAIRRKAAILRKRIALLLLPLLLRVLAVAWFTPSFLFVVCTYDCACGVNVQGEKVVQEGHVNHDGGGAADGDSLIFNEQANTQHPPYATPSHHSITGKAG